MPPLRALSHKMAGGIARCNRTCEEKLSAWLAENRSKRWATAGRMFLRWAINSTFSTAIGMRPARHRSPARKYVLCPPHAGMAPYRAAFGQDARVGISRLPLDAALLEGLSSEAELVQALGAKGDCYFEEVQLEAEVPSSSSKSGRGHEKVKPLKRSEVVVLDEESEGE
ncbi:MAG: hypothetical protein SGPRY_008245, partial [Prymnesium sp.]